jgi:hypothetical protein
MMKRMREGKATLRRGQTGGFAGIRLFCGRYGRMA